MLRIVEHDGAWSSRFAVESDRLRRVINSQIVAIEHVGSTAVPGMLGKPVLDIAIAVTSNDAADSCIAPITALGYKYRGPHGDDPSRRYYVRDDGGQRAVQIHLYIVPAAAWNQKLAFRDALRSDNNLALAYAAEKQRVAKAVGWDKSAYAEQKGPFIQAVLQRLEPEQGI
jgi:GrpB-like predicted nucleotidyltransferase (UPF0157 family)